MSGIQCLDVVFAIESLRFRLMVILRSCKQSGQLVHTLASVTCLVIYTCSFVVASGRWSLIYFLFRISVCCKFSVAAANALTVRSRSLIFVFGFIKLSTYNIFQASDISLDLTNDMLVIFGCISANPEIIVVEYFRLQSGYVAEYIGKITVPTCNTIYSSTTPYNDELQCEYSVTDRG